MQTVKLGASGFFRSLLNLPKRSCVDFLRIAAGIYAVDRICKRNKSFGNESGARQLELIFSVQEVEFWQQTKVQDLLLEVLHLLTGDDWRIGFEQVARDAEAPCFQGFLALPPFKEAKRVGLYSGGLDSAAGLANRILAGADHYLLMTVDHRSGLHNRTAMQLGEMASILQKHRKAMPTYLHSTLSTTLVGGKSKRIAMQEKTQRSRAFLFCTAAAIAAEAYQVETVEMFENGVGAINLPLMAGMLGNGLATSGAHPVFLDLMSRLSTLVTGRTIQFVLPFADKTKAEMIKGLKASKALTAWAQESRSCIHTSIRERGKSHCGYCPGCIERRQAFKAAGVTEDLSAYQMDIFSEPIEKEDDAIYLKLCQLEAQEWLKRKQRPKRRMKGHLRLTGIPEKEHARIMKLQLKHSREVHSVFGPLFKRPEDTAPKQPMAVRG